MNIKIKDTLTLRYSAIQFFFWIAYGSLYSFGTPYLTAYGFSASLIGTLSSVACIVSVLIQPKFSAWADQPRSPSLKKICLVLIAPVIISSLFLYTVRRRDMAVTLGVYAFAMILMQLLVPFVNALATISTRSGRPVNFSFARGMGSAGYAIICMLLGNLTGLLGQDLQQAAVFATAAATMIAIIAFPFEKTVLSADTEQTQSMGFARRYPRFVASIAGCVLIYVSHIYLNTYFYQMVLYKGMGEAEMGTAMAIASASELPTMFLFVLMLRRMKARKWVCLSGIFFTLKAVGTLMVSTRGALYAVMLIQMFGYGLITVAGVAYADSVTGAGDRIRGQTWFAMASTLGTIIGAATGGVMIDHWGAWGTMVAAVITAGAGAIIVFLTTWRDDSVKHNTIAGKPEH